MAADGMAAGKTRDGLRHDRLEDACRDVLLARALVQQRLHVGLREHAAAARDGIQNLMLRGELVKARRVGVQKHRHLVDEGARTAGAGAVHALLDAARVKVDDLRVLAAKLNRHVGLGNESFNGGLARNNLLHELHAEPLGKQQAARAGDGDSHDLVTVFRAGLFQHLDNGRTDVGVVAAVEGVQNLALRIQDGELHGGRPDIDADVKRLARSGGCDGSGTRGGRGSGLRCDNNRRRLLTSGDARHARFHSLCGLFVFQVVMQGFHCGLLSQTQNGFARFTKA